MPLSLSSFLCSDDFVIQLPLFLRMPREFKKNPSDRISRRFISCTQNRSNTTTPLVRKCDSKSGYARQLWNDLLIFQSVFFGLRQIGLDYIRNHFSGSPFYLHCCTHQRGSTRPCLDSLPRARSAFARARSLICRCSI